MLNSKTYTRLCIFLTAIFILIGRCSNPTESEPPVELPKRGDKIPSDAIKITPEIDRFPPVLHSDLWDEPVPMEGPINTAGAEDAPVITPDGNTFFFFFTPDLEVPPEKQLLDSVTGIWWSKKISGTWSEPERIILNDDLVLDGPLCIQGNTLWFASFRNGNYRNDDGDVYTTVLENGKWTNWQNAGQLLNEQYNIGELYTSTDGNIMYFGRLGYGGFGESDIWETKKINGIWTEPANLGATVNTEVNEAQPFLSSDGNELWFTSPSKMGYTGPALFRTLKTASGWSEPEEIISNFAGDPGLDDEGNSYFTHHFFDEAMEWIEADIYVAYRK